MAKHAYSTARRAFLRSVMQMAWSLYRAELSGPTPRTFADALSGAWGWFKARADRIANGPTWAKGARPMHLPMRSMLQSPIRRGLSGPYAGARARSAGYVTSMLGR